MLRIMMKPQTQDHPEPDADELNPGQPDGDVDDAPQGRQPKDEREKVDQPIAGYMGPENGPFMCSRCDFFDESGSCHLVQGPIDPNGCCNMFTPVPDLPTGPDGEEAPEAPIEPEAEEASEEGY